MKNKLIKLISLVALALPMLFATSINVYSTVWDLREETKDAFTEEEVRALRIREEARLAEEARVRNLFEQLFSIAYLGPNITAEDMQAFEVLLTQNVSLAQLNDSVNQHGETLLFVAIQVGNAEIVRFLLGVGVNPNRPRVLDGATPLLVAVQSRSLLIIEMLCRAGADLDQTRLSDGLTPLILASMNGDNEIVKSLLLAGANVNEIGSYFTTALFVAINHRHNEVVETLLDAHVDVDYIGRNMDTALIVASRNNCLEVVKLLLDSGVSKSINQISAYDGLSALGIARKMGHQGMADVIWDEICCVEEACRAKRQNDGDDANPGPSKR